MKVYAKLGNKYTGVNPVAQAPKGGGEKFPVYHDRVQGGAWEEIELTPHDSSGGFLARYVAADKALSMQPDGRLETRDPGTDGGYEVFYATTQPDGTNLLYRIEQNGIVGVLMIEDIA